MANITDTITQAYNDGAATLSNAVSITTGARGTIDETIPASQTDLAVTWAFTKTKLKSIYIVASAAMTLETNSSSAPADTITLTANVPVVWDSTQTFIANPFAGNVTSLFVTTTAGGLLQIRWSYDPT